MDSRFDELDLEVLERLKKKITQKEKDNISLKTMDEKSMVDYIKTEIEREVACKYRE